MNRAFHLVEHRPADPDADPWAVLYTVHLDGEALTETDAFFRDPHVQRHPAAASIKTRYADLHQTFGLYHNRVGAYGEGWFKDAGDGCIALQGKLTPAGRHRLPKPPPRLRLYGFCLDRQTLRNVPALLDDLEPGEPGFPIAVFGGGGVKIRKDPTRCPNVKGHFAAIHHVRRRLIARLGEGTVRIVDDGFAIDGDLTFPASP